MNSQPYALIDGPADYDYCEKSSRCTWNNKKPVTWCSLHEHEEVCKHNDPNYKLKGCYKDRETCLYYLNPNKYPNPENLAPKICDPNDAKCMAQKVSGQKSRNQCNLL